MNIIKKENKPNIAKIDYRFLEDIAKVLDFGESKYGKDNWKNYNGDNLIQIQSAVLRHMGEYQMGNINDDESGLSHLAHAVSNIMFLHYFNRIDNELDEDNIDENDYIKGARKYV